MESVESGGVTKKLIVGEKKRNENLFLFFLARMDFYLTPPDSADSNHTININLIYAKMI